MLRALSHVLVLTVASVVALTGLAGCAADATDSMPPSSNEADQTEAPVLRQLNGSVQRPADVIVAWDDQTTPTEVASTKLHDVMSDLDRISPSRIAPNTNKSPTR